MYIKILNSAGGLLQNNWVPVPSGATWKAFETPTFTNTTGQLADFWVAAEAVARLVDVETTLVQNNVLPQLSLFLDADGNFNPDAPASDADSYLPGSVLATGASEPVATMSGSGQQVQVIAAFVDASGQIVVPPGTGDVTFDLTGVSAFTGIAMNLGTDPGPDFALSGAVCGGGPGWCVPFGADKTARITLIAYDYGGFATVIATRNTSQVTMKLPRDDGAAGGIANNWLPDGGWHVFNVVGQDLGVVPDSGVAADDNDTNPTSNWNGDGLSQYEEFRGFVVGGVHVRTNPTDINLFAYSQFMVVGLGDAWESIPFVVEIRWRPIWFTPPTSWPPPTAA